MSLAALVLAAWIAGCGSGASSTSTSSSVGKPTFLARATAVCKKATQTRVAKLSTTAEEIAARAKPMSKREEQKKFVLEAVLPPERKMVDELIALTPPEGEEEEVEEMLEGLKKGIQRIEAEPSIALKPVVITPADLQVENYGLPECRV